MQYIRSSSLLCVLFLAAFVAHSDAFFFHLFWPISSCAADVDDRWAYIENNAHSDAFSFHWYWPKSACPADADGKWTYRGNNGPDYWGKACLRNNFYQQSGIDINTAQLYGYAEIEPLNFVNYDKPVAKAKMENNGHTIEVTPNDGIARTITVENQTYSLKQYHFHWGCKSNRGSEHTVNGKRYEMEMHLVHMTDDGQIAVVGVFFREQFLMPNSELQKLVSQFSKVEYKGTQTELKNLDLTQLLPTDTKSFYRYDGSLTSPPCSENVKWSVFKDPLTVGYNQMTKFGRLSSATQENASQGCRLCDNFRPVQPLNDIQVFFVQ